VRCYGTPATAVSNILLTISSTKSNCPLYNPRVRKVRLESSRREPTTLLSGGFITNFYSSNDFLAKKYLGIAVSIV
jgi:hypothetical protein